MMSSILAGEDSLFDAETWLSLRCPRVPNSEIPTPEKVDEYLARVCVQIPRLVRLVRAAKKFCHDNTARRKAFELAAALYLDTLEDWIQLVTVKKLLRVVPNELLSAVGLVRQSFGFDSTRLYNRITFYWSLRCIVSGCILALCSLESTKPVIDAAFYVDSAMVAEHERHVAECIAMSYQWACGSNSVFRMCDIRMVQPLMQAFCVWCRMELQSVQEVEAQQARNLQQWALEMLTAIGVKFKSPPVSETKMRFLHEVMTGGPLPGAEDVPQNGHAFQPADLSWTIWETMRDPSASTIER